MNQNSSKLIEAEQRHKAEEERPSARIQQIGEHIGNEPPDLPLQDRGAAEAEVAVDKVAGVDQREHIDRQIAYGNDQHQIRDALISVFQKKALKALAKLIHFIPSDLRFILSDPRRKVYRQIVNSLQRGPLFKYGQIFRKNKRIPS